MEKKRHYVNTLTFQTEYTAKVFQRIARDFFEQEINKRITFDEFTVMDTLVCYPHIDKKILSKTLAMDSSEMDKLLSKLIAKHFVEEIKDNNPQISFQHYKLTNSGDRLYQEINLTKDKTIEILARFISEKELLSFTRTLLKIKNILISLEYIDISD